MHAANAITEATRGWYVSIPGPSSPTLGTRPRPAAPACCACWACCRGGEPNAVRGGASPPGFWHPNIPCRLHVPELYIMARKFVAVGLIALCLVAGCAGKPWHAAA